MGEGETPKGRRKGREAEKGAGQVTGWMQS